MKLQEIETLIESPDPQVRMQGIFELRHHQPSDAVPLLKQKIYDKEFLVRSFAAMGLGYKRTDEGFDILADFIKYETDDSVIAEAANSLAKYGKVAIPYLVQLFESNSHWIVRHSILAALDGKEYPEVLLKLCQIGYEQADPVVKHSVLSSLQQLEGTDKAVEALEIVLNAASDSIAETRAAAAISLRAFDDPKAKSALLELRHDPDHRVIAATLEGLL